MSKNSTKSDRNTIIQINEEQIKDHLGEMVRGTVALPSGTGKDIRIAVFAQGEAATAARDAGADHVGGDDLAAEVEDFLRGHNEPGGGFIGGHLVRALLDTGRSVVHLALYDRIINIF